MKVLYPKEFIETTGKTTLTEYVEYLKSQKEDAKEVLTNAKEVFSLDKTVTDEIEGQLKEILNLLDIIEKHMYRVVLSSIEGLSLEELQAYFVRDKEDLETSLKDIQDQIARTTVELEEVGNRIAAGKKLDDEYYSHFEAKDTKDFFEEIDDRQYLEGLVSIYLPSNLKDSIFEILKRQVDAYGLDRSDKDLISIADRIVETLKKSKGVLRRSESAKNGLVDVLLNGGSLTVDLGEGLEVDIVDSLIRLGKERTSFFNGLSEDTKKELLEAEFTGAKYEELKEAFNNMHRVITRKSNIKKEDKETESKLLDTLDAQLNKQKRLSSSYERLVNNFFQNREAMQKRLRNTLISYLGSTVSLDEIDILDDAMKTTDKLTNKTRASLEAASYELDEKRAALNEVELILNGEHYATFFENAKLRNKLKAYRELDMTYTEDAIEPILEAENKRLEQIHAIIDMQVELERIQKQVEEFKKNASWWYKVNPMSTYKDDLDDFEDLYREAIREGFDKLQEKDLLQVCNPGLDGSSSPDIVKPLPKKPTVMVTSFDGRFLVEQEYWDFSTCLTKDEEIQFASWCGVEDGEHFSEITMHTQRALIKKLLSYTKELLGYTVNGDRDYLAEMTSEERTNLIDIQERVIWILSEIYNKYRRNAEALEDGERDYLNSKSEIGTIGKLIGSKDDIDREKVERFKTKTANEISDLERYLYVRRSLCEEFGIIVPQVEGEYPEIDLDLNRAIKELRIPGVVTLEEAKSFRNVLLSLNDLILSEEQVKRFYLETVQK